MAESNDQLTRAQLVGMILFGLCFWAIIIGLIYALVADKSFPGLVVAVTGGIGGFILFRWLIFINESGE